MIVYLQKKAHDEEGISTRYEFYKRLPNTYLLTRDNNLKMNTEYLVRLRR